VNDGAGVTWRAAAEGMFLRADRAATATLPPPYRLPGHSRGNTSRGRLIRACWRLYSVGTHDIRLRLLVAFSTCRTPRAAF